MITTINQARAAIYERIATLNLPTDWGDANIEMTPTADVWIRPSVRFASGGVTSLGGQTVATRRARGGTVIIQVFSPIGQGEEPGDVVTDQLVRLFEGMRDGPIMYRNVAVRDVGRDESWWQSNVTAEFDFEVVCV